MELSWRESGRSEIGELFGHSRVPDERKERILSSRLPIYQLFVFLPKLSPFFLHIRRLLFYFSVLCHMMSPL